MWLIAYHLARSALLLEVEAAEAALAAPKDSDLRVMGLWVRVVEADDIVRFKLGLLEAREGDANFVGFVLGLVGAFRRSSTADGSLSAPPRAFFVSANDGVEKNFCVASSTFEGDDALELCDVRALRWGELGRVSVLTFAGCPLIGLLLSEPPLPLTYSIFAGTSGGTIESFFGISSSTSPEGGEVTLVPAGGSFSHAQWKPPWPSGRSLSGCSDQVVSMKRHLELLCQV